MTRPLGNGSARSAQSTRGNRGSTRSGKSSPLDLSTGGHGDATARERQGA
jgi:hypothetical protein